MTILVFTLDIQIHVKVRTTKCDTTIMWTKIVHITIMVFIHSPNSLHCSYKFNTIQIYMYNMWFTERLYSGNCCRHFGICQRYTHSCSNCRYMYTTPLFYFVHNYVRSLESVIYSFWSFFHSKEKNGEFCRNIVQFVRMNLHWWVWCFSFWRWFSFTETDGHGFRNRNIVHFVHMNLHWWY